MVATRWRKSSKSGQDATCVEVAGSLAAIRESKHPAVRLPADVARLTAAIRRGELRRSG